eukprot:SAG31_NODE_3671_length_4002_cov_3.065334_1_plen_184_part_00
MGRRAAAAGASSATVGAPPQLQPVLLSLPHLDEQSFAMALANAHLQVDPTSDRSAELELKLHQAGVLNRVTMEQFSASCSFLIRQANRAGTSAASLSTRLRPLGFAGTPLCLPGLACPFCSPAHALFTWLCCGQPSTSQLWLAPSNGSDSKPCILLRPHPHLSEALSYPMCHLHVWTACLQMR